MKNGKKVSRSDVLEFLRKHGKRIEAEDLVVIKIRVDGATNGDGRFLRERLPFVLGSDDLVTEFKQFQREVSPTQEAEMKVVVDEEEARCARQFEEMWAKADWPEGAVFPTG